MTSEIRANTLKNRVGLGTVSYTNTGPVVSGIVTATGIELTGTIGEDAARIKIPDGMNGGPFTGNLEFGNNRDFVMLHDGHHNYVKANNGNIYVTVGGNVLTTLQTNGTVLLNKDLDVDGHTNLDNVSIAGVTTFTGQSTFNGALDINNNVVIDGNIDLNGDLDVDGHTNLDNVSIAGVTTVSNKTQVNSLGIGIQPIDHHHIHIESANPRVLIRSTGTNSAKIFFGDSSSNDPGVIEYDHTNNRMRFGTNNTEDRVIIASNGKLHIGGLTTNSTGSFASVIATGGELNNGGFQAHYNSGAYGGGSMTTVNAAGGGLDFWTYTGNVGSESYSRRLRINSSGNMGLGVIPSANWPDGDFRALQLGTGMSIFGRGSGDEDRGGIAVNYYQTGSAQKYIGNGHAGRIYFEDGSIVFSNTGPTANSSGANAAMTLINRLQITPTGRFKVNHTSTNSKLDDTWLSIYDANSDSSAIDPAGISKNYAMISLHNYGTGVPGDSTGIGFGAGSGFNYVKGSIAFARSGSYGTGDLVFLTNNDQDATMVNDTDEKMRITRDDKVKITGVVETGPKTITGGNNLAIQNFAVKGVWSGASSIGKSIELISGYDSAVKMAAIGYNLTDVNLGSTYGGDLTFHTQPLYSSPTTPIPERMRISSSGYITKSVVPSWNLRPYYNSTQTTSNTSSHHAIGWSDSSSGNGATTSKACFLQNCSLHGSGFTYNLHNGQNYAKLRVPVAGRYYVNVTYRVENNPQQGNIYVYVNNSQIARQHVEMWAHRPYMHCQWASVLNLAKNDEILISISCANANVSGRNDNVNWFSGYLIG